MLVLTDETKDTLKKYEEQWNKIWSITNNLDNYDKKYMKIKFNSNDLSLKKMLLICFSWEKQILLAGFFRWKFV